jgi:hypothetical protein
MFAELRQKVLSPPDSPSQKEQRNQITPTKQSLLDLDSMADQDPFDMRRLTDELMNKLAFKKICKRSSDQPGSMHHL